MKPFINGQTVKMINFSSQACVMKKCRIIQASKKNNIVKMRIITIGNKKKKVNSNNNNSPKKGEA